MKTYCVFHPGVCDPNNCCTGRQRQRTCDWCDGVSEVVCENVEQAQTCDGGWKIRAEKNTDERTIEPEHYKQFEIEPLEFCARNKLDVFQTNIIKYVCRHNMKNGVEDIRKAINYAFKYIAFLTGDKLWIKVGTPKLP